MLRALVSLSDKTGLAEFARALGARGVEIVSTGGTAKALADAGLPVVNVSDVTGFPEMMDGRVKTLHPKVHGGILARRADPAHVASAHEHQIGLIDLVVVNLYPFAAAAANRATPFDQLIEEIDIGGPSLVRGAAKNFADVLVVVDPQDYPAVLEQLDRPGGPSLAFRFDLARKAFAHTAAYDAAIASTLAQVSESDGVLARRAEQTMPSRLTLALEKLRDLRYGENPHQPAAWYAPADRAGLGQAAVLQGKELSFTEPAGSRRRGAHRARVRRARRRDREAHQPVRRRHRRRCRRCLRARARSRRHVRVRRHRGAEPAHRRRDGARDRVHPHRRRDRAGGATTRRGTCWRASRRCGS